MTEKILFFFALAGIGFALRKRGTVGGQGVRQLIVLTMDVLMPALNFYTAASRLTMDLAAPGKLFAGPLLGLPLTAVLVIAAGGLLSWVTAGLAGLKGKRKATFIVLVTFANSSFLPIPLSYALNGENGVLFVNMYNLSYIPILWTVGMWLMGGKAALKYAFHPAPMALIAGAIFGMTGTRLPEWLLDALRLLGNSAIPLAMICVGAVMAEQPLGFGRDLKPLLFVSAEKLVVVPLLAVMALGRVAVPEPMHTQAILQAAMPCMAQAGLYTVRFGGDVGLASRAAFLTTVLSIITVPLFLGMLR